MTSRLKKGVKCPFPTMGGVSAATVLRTVMIVVTAASVVIGAAQNAHSSVAAGIAGHSTTTNKW